VGARPLAQGALDARQRLGIQARFAAGAARGAQGAATALAPGAVPAHDTLAADAEAPRDRALRLPARRKQPRRVLPTNFQPVEISSWSHMSGWHAPIVRRGKRTSVTILCEIQ